MKRRYLIFTTAVGLLIFIFVSGSVLAQKLNVKSAKPRYIKGTKLELIHEVEQLGIAVYVDKASTNRLADFAIFIGNEPLVTRENQFSNLTETTHFENGLYVCKTIREISGRIVERRLSYSDEQSERQKYTYIDKDGDGLWDVLIIFGKQGQKTKTLMRTNDCWVPSAK